jgi:hypothetical protein
MKFTVIAILLAIAILYQISSTECRRRRIITPNSRITKTRRQTSTRTVNTRRQRTTRAIINRATTRAGTRATTRSFANPRAPPRGMLSPNNILAKSK